MLCLLFSLLPATHAVACRFDISPHRSSSPILLFKWFPVLVRIITKLFIMAKKIGPDLTLPFFPHHLLLTPPPDPPATPGSLLFPLSATPHPCFFPQGSAPPLATHGQPSPDPSPRSCHPDIATTDPRITLNTYSFPWLVSVSVSWNVSSVTVRQCPHPVARCPCTRPAPSE